MKTITINNTPNRITKHVPDFRMTTASEATTVIDGTGIVVSPGIKV